jgi:molybdopterin-containing oxidoreductase family membrane subunit
VFWWTGLLPDFAMLEIELLLLLIKVYSILSFGWSGRAKDWQRFEEVSLVLAGLATPLVFLHTIVSMDFATSVIPGWHTQFSLRTLLLGLFFWVCNGKHYHEKLSKAYCFSISN